MLNIKGVIFWSVWVFLAVVAIPSIALAWGPGAHMETSSFILQSLFLVAPAARAALKKHPSAFMYGALYPDMILGKKYMRPEHNNHRWEVGFKVLSGARNLRQESFALGYLTHLAADTVAHNDYIPDLLLDQFSRRGWGHMTFELVFDVALPDSVWSDMRFLSVRDFKECEKLVLKSIPRTPVPGALNHRVFRGGAMLVRTGGWETIIKRLRPRMSRGLKTEIFSPYSDAMRSCSLDILNNLTEAGCLARCPTGGSVLSEAEDLRKLLRNLNRRKEIGIDGAQNVVSAFRRWREGSSMLEPSRAQPPLPGGKLIQTV